MVSKGYYASIAAYDLNNDMSYSMFTLSKAKTKLRPILEVGSYSLDKVEVQMKTSFIEIYGSRGGRSYSTSMVDTKLVKDMTQGYLKECNSWVAVGGPKSSINLEKLNKFVFDCPQCTNVLHAIGLESSLVKKVGGGFIKSLSEVDLKYIKPHPIMCVIDEKGSIEEIKFFTRSKEFKNCVVGRNIVGEVRQTFRFSDFPLIIDDRGKFDTLLNAFSIVDTNNEGKCIVGEGVLDVQKKIIDKNIQYVSRSGIKLEITKEKNFFEGLYNVTGIKYEFKDLTDFYKNLDYFLRNRNLNISYDEYLRGVSLEVKKEIICNIKEKCCKNENNKR
jgi:hypothetical protein